MKRQRRPITWPRCLCGAAIYYRGDRHDMTPYDAVPNRVHTCDYTESVRRDREELAAREFERGGAA